MPAHGAYGLSAATLSSDRIRCCVACILNEMNAARPNEQTCSLREGCSDKGLSGNANGLCVSIWIPFGSEWIQSSFEVYETHNSPRYEQLVRGFPGRASLHGV